MERIYRSLGNVRNRKILAALSKAAFCAVMAHWHASKDVDSTFGKDMLKIFPSAFLRAHSSLRVGRRRLIRHEPRRIPSKRRIVSRIDDVGNVGLSVVRIEKSVLAQVAHRHIWIVLGKCSRKKFLGLRHSVIVTAVKVSVHETDTEIVAYFWHLLKTHTQCRINVRLFIIFIGVGNTQHLDTNRASVRNIVTAPNDNASIVLIWQLVKHYFLDSVSTLQASAMLASFSMAG